MRLRQIVLIAVIGLLGAAPAAVGQTSQTGIIQGKVTDADGAAIPGAIVSVAQLDGSYPRSAITDDDGFYRVAFLPPGNYVVAVRAEGFTPRTVEDARVNAGRTQRVDITLMGVHAETIEVTASAPLIDRSSTELPTTLMSEAIQQLPNPRDVTSLINFTPGAREGSIWGAASSQANSYQFDGVSVDQPGFGGTFLLPNIDWVEEFQVRGLGAGAEYGNFQGGLVNIVTKSGSNTLKANLRMNYEAESLNSSNINLGEEGGEQDQRWELNADVSGPIIEDSLYYFFSVAQIDTDYRVVDFPKTQVEQNIAFLPTMEERSEQKLFGKLTWQATDRDLFNLVLGYDSVDMDRRGISSFVNPEATVQQDSPSWFYNLTWGRTFREKAFLEVKLTGYQGEDERTPYNGELPAVQELGGNRELWRNAIYTRLQEPESTGLTVNLDTYLDWGPAQHHLKIGGEFTSGSWLERRTRHANLTWRPRVINDPVGWGDPPFDPNDPNTWLSLISSDWGGNIRLDAETENGAIYVQDYARFTDRLTVNAGLRYGFWSGSITPGFGDGPQFDVVDADAIDPRIGVVYDFTGAGDWVAKAHWGRYHQSLFALMFDRIEGGEVFQNLEYWDWVGDGLPDINRNYTLEEIASSPNWAFYDDDPIGEETGPIVDWDQPYVDQVVLSLEHSFTNRFKMGVTYVNRVNEEMLALIDRNLDSNYVAYNDVTVTREVFGEGGEFLGYEPIMGPDGGPLVLDTVYVATDDIIYENFAPGLTQEQIDALDWNQDLVITNPDDAERELDQVQLSGDYRGRRWSLHGSLVWSDLIGNFNSVSGYANTFGTGAGGFVRPNEQVNWNGRLPGFSEWETKLRGRVELPAGFGLGAFLRYFSGDYYTPVHDIDDREYAYVTAGGVPLNSVDRDDVGYNLLWTVNGQDIFVEEQGSREFESETTLDLRVDKTFVFGEIEWVLAVDAFNVLNNDAERSVITSVNDIGDLDFGDVVLRQPPRTVRLSTSLHW
jgi:hypothetical protein